MRSIYETFFGCFGRCRVNLCGNIIYRLFFVRHVGTLQTVTFRHIWLPLKHDIKVSNYAMNFETP